MKKILLLAMAILLGISSSIADNQLKVDDVIIPQGGSVAVAIELDNPDNVSSGFQFLMSFNQNITASNPEHGDRITSDFSLQIVPKEGGFQTLVYNDKGLMVTGASGTVMILTLTADPSLPAGTIVQGSLTNCAISTPGGSSVELDDVHFTVTVSDKTILDEKSKTVPLASSDPVDIIVKRTINANEWSTLVLPFGMTDAKVKEIFGDDVILAEFESYDVEKEGSEVTAITVNFTETDLAEDGFVANCPYLIKTSQNITSFEVNAEIDPNEEDAFAEYTNGKSGAKKVVYGTMLGTLHAGSVVPANSLFLSGNDFWYSAGATKIKAFRAYFTFQDVLSGVGGAAKMRFFIGNEETSISDVDAGLGATKDVYTLQGVALGKKNVHDLPKGIYIIEGKKVRVK